jgi:hypothetical protein
MVWPRSAWRRADKEWLQTTFNFSPTALNFACRLPAVNHAVAPGLHASLSLYAGHVSLARKPAAAGGCGSNMCWIMHQNSLRSGRPFEMIHHRYMGIIIVGLGQECNTIRG